MDAALLEAILPKGQANIGVVPRELLEDRPEQWQHGYSLQLG